MTSEDFDGATLSGRYRIDKLLAEGGMAMVYRGTHTVVGRPVAIKILKAQFIDSPDEVRRFVREAQTAAAIVHPGIVQILDVGVTDEGAPYLVMEHLDGESLAEVNKRHAPVDLPTATAILEPLLRALSAAHKRGVIHRDLKPANVVLALDPEGGGPASVKLIDFGIAKLKAQSAAKLTHAGSLLGTPLYMAPEQVCEDIEVDYRADLYSAGVIFYELLTGEPPFVSSSVHAVLWKVVTDAPASPYNANPTFPAAAEVFLRRALAKAPDERFQSAQEMLDELATMPGAHDREVSLSALIERRGDSSPPGSPQAVASSRPSDRPLSAVESTAAAQIVEDVLSRKDKRPASIGRGRWRAAGLLLLATAMVGAAAGLSLNLFRNVAPEQRLTPLSVAPAPRPVIRLEIKDAPPGAAVRLDGDAMPGLAFTVPPSSEETDVLVEAPGFEPFRARVVPDRDREIYVSLRRLASAESLVPTETEHSSTPQQRRGDGTKKAKPVPADRFIEGGRKTAIVDEFQ